MAAMKVYCEDCKFFKGALWIDVYTDCYATLEYRDNYRHVEEFGDEARERNKNNNCKHYKRIWWKFWVK